MTTLKTTFLIVSAVFSISVQAQNNTFIPLVEIPSGTFYMGDDGRNASPDEAPVHRVSISHAFRMGKYEVTNAEYEQFRPEHKALRGKNNVSTEDDDAVVNVSWQDAVDFCAWLSKREGKTYRLPTEAEWEYACRVGSYTQFSTGDGLPASMQRNQTIARDYQTVSLKVGQTPANDFGLCDMHGNVEEWCADWYAPYKSADQTDPVGPADGLYRVTRGGSHHTPVQYLRSANRMAMIPEDRHSLTGFRVVQSDYALPSAVVDKDKPFFLEPIPFVVPPATADVPETT